MNDWNLLKRGIYCYSLFKKRLFCLFVFITLSLSLYSVTLDGMVPTQKEGQFSLFQKEDDSNDYSRVLEVLVENYNRLTALLNPDFCEKVDIYIYPDQKSLWIDVFDTAEMTIKVRGFADPKNRRIYLTSPYEDCYRPGEAYTVPVHELVHILYPHSWVFIREGLAEYLSGRTISFSPDDLPEAYHEFGFYQGEVQTRKAYNFSGWLMRYIVEEIGQGDFNLFLEYAANPEDYSILGFADSSELFKQWRVYMLTQYQILEYSSILES